MPSHTEWYHSFFSGMYSRILGNRYDDLVSAGQVVVIRKLLHLRKGQRVLDVPCGKGRITIPLARQGLEMTGVDLTGSYLKAARRRARLENLDVRFIHSDMREIDFEEEFHAVFNWFGSFGYFSDEDNVAFCRRVRRALKPGGRFLIDGANKSFLARDFVPYSEHDMGGTHVVIRNRWDRRKQRVLGEWTFTRGTKTEVRATDMRVYNAAELRALLAEAGFSDVSFYGRPPLQRFTRHCRKILAVARKDT